MDDYGDDDNADTVAQRAKNRDLLKDVLEERRQATQLINQVVQTGEILIEDPGSGCLSCVEKILEMRPDWTVNLGLHPAVAVQSRSATKCIRRGMELAERFQNVNWIGPELPPNP